MPRHLPEDWLVPQLDANNHAFFTSGKLMIQECAGCGALQHPPEDVCRDCQGIGFRFREVAPRGSIYSYTVVRHPTHPALSQAIPYVVVLVSPDELPGVRITGNLLQIEPEKVRIGMRVRAIWEEVKDEAGNALRLPQWVPA